MGLTRPPTEAANIKDPGLNRKLAPPSREPGSEVPRGWPMVDIAFGRLILWQLLESIQRIDKRLRRNKFISVSDRALEHRVFLSLAYI
jgi:hypothetical protein